MFLISLQEVGKIKIQTEYIVLDVVIFVGTIIAGRAIYAGLEK
jgi:hypothetical protein